MVNRTRSVAMVFSHVRFANDILGLRLELGLTGEEIGAISGIEKSTLYKYERATVDNMKMQNYLAICNFYDLDPREYFELER